MKTYRIRIVSVDVIKVDFPRGLAFLAYTLRSPVGDNHSVTDVGLDTPEKMCEELYEAARNKAVLLAEVFSGIHTTSDRYQVADYRATREKLAPLFRRLLSARKKFNDGGVAEEEQSLLETDGVHLLRPELDLEGRSVEERAEILVKRALRHLEQSDPEPARLMAQRALRLKPHDSRAQDVLNRCQERAI